MRDGPPAGLRLIDAILESGELADYALAHSARAELLRRLNRVPEARLAYSKALELTRLLPERRFLERRLESLGGPAAGRSLRARRS
jgi:RNA polymerase sigma-70 factor (ECF subfamily)